MRMSIRWSSARMMVLAPVVLASCTLAAEPSGSLPKPETVLPILEKNATAQLAAMNGKTPADWTAAAFYVGLARLTHFSKNPKFEEALSHIAEANHWQVNPGKNGRHFFADDEAVGQMYIDLALTKKDTKLLEPLIKEQTALLDQLAHYNVEVSNPNAAKNADAKKLEVIPWWWCDALFMNPAVLARLSAVTGDQKYLDAMDKAWDETTALLYDKQEHLYYRDNRFPGMKSKNGQKVFWSRGNGWVMGGLCEVLTYMPKDYPQRAKYEALFKDMAEKLLTLQGEDGLWRASLEDPQEQPHPESSGSGFFTYAFAWGINNGLLDRTKFEPAVIKGWNGLVHNLRPDGQMGYVQQVGFKPDPTKPEDTQYYGNGAFLLAGTEIIRMSEHPAKQ